MLWHRSHTSESKSYESKIFIQFFAIILVFSLAGTLVYFRRLNLEIERELGDINKEVSVAKSENSDLRRRITELASPVRVLGAVRGDSIKDETSKALDVIITKEELNANRAGTSDDLFASVSVRKEESLIATLGNSAFFTGSAHAKD